jgi:phosphate starvation-inducible PhoH-like protein
LVEAVRILNGVEGISRVIFKEADVVRHDLVRRIVAAYDTAAREAPPQQEQFYRDRDRRP